MQNSRITIVSNWWGRRGENEIDMIALNEFDKTGVVAEIKRNKKKLYLAKLTKKMEQLPSDFSQYTLSSELLSLEDM